MDHHITREPRTFTGETLVVALERLIRSLVVSPPTQSTTGDAFLLGFTVEAPDISSAIGEAIGQISALASDNSADIVDCEVSGVQQTDEGHRIWGTIECTPSVGPVLRESVPQVREVKVEPMAPELWHITVLSIRQAAP